MKLKSKLVALSLVTLLLPWSGWKLLQEMERYLREAQETSLLASARLVASALPLDFQTRLSFAPDAYVPMRGLRHRPSLDGYDDDWPEAGQGMEFRTGDGTVSVSLLAGRHAERLYLFFAVRLEMAPAPSGRLAHGAADQLTLLIRNPRGLLRYTISPGAPGPLQLRSETGEAGQGEGFWLDTPQGFRVELSLPGGGVDSDIAFQVAPAATGQTCWNVPGNARQDAPRLSCRAGTSEDIAADWPARAAWANLMPEWRRLSSWLAGFADASSRVWLVDRDGWVLADSDSARMPGGTSPGTGGSQAGDQLEPGPGHRGRPQLGRGAGRHRWPGSGRDRRADFL